MKRKILSIIFYLLLTSSFAQDMIELKNGRAIGGMLLAEDGSFLSFRSSVTGAKMKINYGSIDRYYIGRRESYQYPARMVYDHMSKGEPEMRLFFGEIRGKIRMYYMVSGSNFNGFQTTEKHYYLQKGDSGIMRISQGLLNSEEGKELMKDGSFHYLTNQKRLARLAEES